MNVLKKIIFAVLFLTGSYICSAQEISIRGGFNLSQMRIKLGENIVSKNTSLMPGFQVGPIVAFPLNSALSLESGLLYSTKGYKEIGDRTIDQKSLYRINIAYLDIPLGLRFSHQFRKTTFLINGGGYVAQALFGNILSKEDRNGTEHIREKVNWGSQEGSFRRLDYGLNLGLGMKFNSVLFGISYEHGIANIAGNDRNTTKARNRCLGFYLSYLLWNN